MQVLEDKHLGEGRGLLSRKSYINQAEGTGINNHCPKRRLGKCLWRNMLAGKVAGNETSEVRVRNLQAIGYV